MDKITLNESSQTERTKLPSFFILSSFFHFNLFSFLSLYTTTPLPSPPSPTPTTTIVTFLKCSSILNCWIQPNFLICEIFCWIESISIWVISLMLRKVAENWIEIDRSFGFQTTIEMVQQAINVALVEAESAINSICFVKLMGRSTSYTLQTMVLWMDILDLLLVLLMTTMHTFHWKM